MAQAIQKSSPGIITQLQDPKMKAQLAAALPKHITDERFIRMALTCIRNVPKLANCDIPSVLSCMFELAQLGLEPNTPLGQAYILPYGSKASVILGYKGYIKLADNNGITLNAEAVYDGDRFDFALGTEPYIKHVPTEDPQTQGSLRYAYAVARFRDGRSTFKVVGKPDIERAKQASSAYRMEAAKKNPTGPWFTDES